MGKYISGFAKETNLDKWADYARKNSYGDNKPQAKDQLRPVGRGGRENDYSDDWKQPQKKQEGRCWADMKATTADKTYTGKGGSKR
jgi:hypothetical protein